MVFLCLINIHVLMHTGILMHVFPFKDPCTALFFNCSPNKLIVACRDDIFIVDASTHSTQAFSGTPQGPWYFPQAIALYDEDAVLLAGSSFNGVCKYNTASLTRMWIHDTERQVVSVCLLGAHVLVAVFDEILVINYHTGAKIASLKAEGYVYGLGVIESLWFIAS